MPRRPRNTAANNAGGSAGQAAAAAAAPAPTSQPAAAPAPGVSPFSGLTGAAPAATPAAPGGSPFAGLTGQAPGAATQAPGLLGQSPAPTATTPGPMESAINQAHGSPPGGTAPTPGNGAQAQTLVQLLGEVGHLKQAQEKIQTALTDVLRDLKKLAEALGHNRKAIEAGNSLILAQIRELDSPQPETTPAPPAIAPGPTAQAAPANPAVNPAIWPAIQSAVQAHYSTGGPKLNLNDPTHMGALANVVVAAQAIPVTPGVDPTTDPNVHQQIKMACTAAGHVDPQGFINA